MYHFETTTGAGLKAVDVYYSYDEDVNTVCDVEICTLDGLPLNEYLTDDTFADIEMECYEDLPKQILDAKETAQMDQAQARYEQRMEAA